MSRPGAWQGLATSERMGLIQLTPDQNLIQFTRPGTFYWVPPPGLLAVRVMKVDSGSGGGSGRIDPLTNAIHCGGGGGAGGAASDHTVRVAGRPDLFDRWEIIVGAGGVGGASVTGGSASNGNAGGAGVLSRVNLPSKQSPYALVNNSAATGGAAGTATAGAGGTAGGGPLAAGGGGTASTTGDIGAAPSSSATVAPPGGGSGGGLTTSNVAGVGGNGGVWTLTGTGLSVAAATGGSQNGRGADGYPGPVTWGTGAGGGGASTTTGGDGGNGIFGSGGGGGGAATTTSGKGGNGGDGAVFLFLIWG